MVLVDVEVQRAGVVEMWAADQCSANLGSIFLVVLCLHCGFVLAWDYTLVHWLPIIFPVRPVHLSWHHETSFFLTQRLSTVGNSTVCLSLNSSCVTHCGEPGSGKNKDDLHRVCLIGYRDRVGWFHGSLQCIRASTFLSRWDDRPFSKQTRWHL